MPRETDWTEVLPPARDDAPLPPFVALAPPWLLMPRGWGLAAGWSLVCAYVTLGLWSWGLVDAARALYGLG